METKVSLKESSDKLFERIEKVKKRVNQRDIARFFNIHFNTLQTWQETRPKVFLALAEWYSTFYPVEKEELTDDDERNNNEATKRVG